MGDLLTLIQTTGLLLVALSPAIESPDDQEPIRWAVGRELDKAVKTGVSGQWAETPIGGLLQQLSRRQRIALFVDRRVDGTTKINLSARNLTWEQLLLEIGQPHDYFYCRIEDVYYFGPRDVCMTLPDVYDNLRSELRKRRDDLQVNWRIPVQTNWPRLSQPRQLLDELGEQFSIELLSANQIKHDLWNQFESAPVPLMLKVCLLTTGFDRAFVVSKTGSRLKVVKYPLVEKCQWTVKYLEDAKSSIRTIQGEYPRVKMRAVSRKVVDLSGKVETVYKAVCALVAQQTALGGSGTSTFTLELKGTRGVALATMARELDVELNFVADAREILAEYVERDFKNATIEDIITGVLQGTGLKYKIDEKQLTIE